MPFQLIATDPAGINAMVASSNPYREQRYKINTCLVESAIRENEVESLYTWLFLRALDLERHTTTTGCIVGIRDIQERLALKMQRSVRTIKSYITNAEKTGYIDIVDDTVWIRSRHRITIAKWRVNYNEKNGSLHHPNNILEVSVQIPEVWDAHSRAVSLSRLISIIQQRCTEAGYCRETLALLVGLHSRSTARIDQNQNKKRGWQYGFIELDQLFTKNLEYNAQLFISTYQKYASALSGHGKKFWLGKTPEGKSAVVTQLAVKWITPFSGRLKPDKDVASLAKSSISASTMGECRSLHPVQSGNGRDAIDMRLIGNVTETMRHSIWDTIQIVVANAGIEDQTNRRPTIRVDTQTTWSSSFGRSHESSNRITRKTKETSSLSEASSVVRC